MSAARRKKLKRFVPDTNVWVAYVINGELEWLTHYVIQNRLIIYASLLLFDEIKRVLQYARIKKYLVSPPSVYLRVINSLVLVSNNVPVIVNSPDPEHDYIFSLAIF